MIRLPGAPGRPALIGFLRRLARSLRWLGDSVQRLVEQIETVDEEIQSLRADIDRIGRRHEQLADQFQEREALGWDYVAIIRRLAALEDHVEALSMKAEAASRGRDGRLSEPEA